MRNSYIGDKVTLYFRKHEGHHEVLKFKLLYSTCFAFMSSSEMIQLAKHLVKLFYSKLGKSKSFCFADLM